VSRGQHAAFRRRWPWILAIALVAAGGSAIAISAALDRDDSATAEPAGTSVTPPGSPTPPVSATPTSPPSPVRTPRGAPPPFPGYLLIADRGNDRMLLVDGRKRVLWAYPKPGTTPEMPFHFDDDTFFGSSWDRIVSNQEHQQTIQVISFPGRKVRWAYGHINVAGSRPGFLHTPDDAYLLPNGNVMVADVGNCRILVISPSSHVVRQLGTTGACGHDPPRLFAAPNGDTPMPGGGVLVTEINGSWVDRIGPNGHLIQAFQTPATYPSDAQWLGGGRVLLADYANRGQVLIMTTGGKVLFRYGPPSGPGALDHPSLALMLPNGLIAVNDDYRDRVVLISRRTHRIVWQYGHTDLAGGKKGFLNTPDGMDFLPFDVAMRNPEVRRIVLRRGR
jgi:hypothetical protein